MDVPATSVWTREPRQAKVPALGRVQIVREAMALLDAEGLDALSMRKLATRLNSGATSIYWHVTSKDELLELVLDEVYGEFEVTLREEVRWRDHVQRFAYAMRDALIRHVWAIPLVGTRPAIGPNALRVMNELMQTFESAGFRGFNVDFAAASVLSYVLGAVAPEASWQAMVAKSGGDPKTVHASMRPLLEKAAADYPHLIERYASYGSQNPVVLRALGFDFGLMCLLDGLAVRLDQQEPATADRSVAAG
jgi:AcrR family transcriptional regulator